MISFDEFLGLAISSDTALSHKITNIPTEEHKANLQLVYDNVYLPLSKQFEGNIKINSGYRSRELNAITPGSSLTSEHCLGMALDLRGLNKVTNKMIFDWLRANVKYHQLIWERGTSSNPQWVHIGYNKNKLINQTEKTTTINGEIKYLPY